MLIKFTAEKGRRIAAWYVENASGAVSEGSELKRSIEDAEAGDMLLIEQVNRLTRLNKKKSGSN
tara:strand:+ start:1257 stop:1448 length:192 start_codon:yes stop_codon:yes gene_type:complete